MVCEKCGGDTTVVDTIKQDDAIYRKRKCNACSHYFFTEEVDSDGRIFRELNKAREEKRRHKKQK